MRLTSKRLTVYFIGLCILFSLVLPTVSPAILSFYQGRAYAAPEGTSLPLSTQIEIWQFFTAVSMNKDQGACELHTKVNAGDARAGKLLHAQNPAGNPSNIWKGRSPVGLMVRESGPDGIINCDDSDQGKKATLGLIETLGYGGEIDSFLKEIGYREEGGNYLIDSPTKAREGLNKLLLRYATPIPSLGVIGERVKGYKYASAIHAFEHFCKASVKTGSDAEKNAKDGIGGWYKILTVGADGTLVERVYQIEKKGSDRVGVGPYAGYASDSVFGMEHCNGIARELAKRDLANAFAALLSDPNVIVDTGTVGADGTLATTSANASAGGSNNAANVGELGCNFPGALSWFICPFVELLNTAISGIDSMITRLLTISPNHFNVRCEDLGEGAPDEEACKNAKAYYSAWSSFRTLALGIVIIAALVIIIGTALGYELLDAYTIRKVLPRVIFSIIFIALSWHILAFFVVLTNDIGNGLRWLIYQPFLTSDLAPATFDVSSLGWMAIFGGVTGAAGFFAIGGASAIAPVMLPAIATFLLAGLIIMLVAVLIMVLRELIVLMLVILAPIGIACYILPNTQKGWQLWQNTLTTMLLAFPIIAAIIAFGRVFAAASYNGSGSFGQFIGLIAYFIPYFLIPYSFRLAGGALAGLANIANNSERGVFDRMRNYRQGKAQKHMEEVMAGKHKGLGANVARRLRSSDHGGLSLTKGGRSRFKSHTQNQSLLFAAKAPESDLIGGLMDDDATEIASNAQTRMEFVNAYMAKGKTRDQALQALGKIESATGARVGSQTMKAAAYRANMLSNSANDPDIENVVASARAAGKNEAEVRAAVDEAIRAKDEKIIRMSESIRSAGVMDLDTQAGILKSNKSRPDRGNLSFGDARKFLNHEGDVTTEHSRIWDKQALGKISGYNATHADERTAHVVAHRLMQEIDDSGSNLRPETLAKLADIQDTLPGVSTDMKVIFSPILQREVDGMSIVQHIDQRRDELKPFRREYSNGPQADNAARARLSDEEINSGLGSN